MRVEGLQAQASCWVPRHPAQEGRGVRGVCDARACVVLGAVAHDAEESFNNISACGRSQMTEEELWAESRTNLGLEELLVQERIIFQTLGVMHSKLEEYKENLATLCPAGFPAVSEWADSSSDAEIGVVCANVCVERCAGLCVSVWVWVGAPESYVVLAARHAAEGCGYLARQRRAAAGLPIEAAEIRHALEPALSDAGPAAAKGGKGEGREAGQRQKRQKERARAGGI